MVEFAKGTKERCAAKNGRYSLYQGKERFCEAVSCVNIALVCGLLIHVCELYLPLRAGTISIKLKTARCAVKSLVAKLKDAAHTVSE